MISLSLQLVTSLLQYCMKDQNLARNLASVVFFELHMKIECDTFIYSSTTNIIGLFNVKV